MFELFQGTEKNLLKVMKAIRCRQQTDLQFLAKYSVSHIVGLSQWTIQPMYAMVVSWLFLKSERDACKI